MCNCGMKIIYALENYAISRNLHTGDIAVHERVMLKNGCLIDADMFVVSG